MSGTNGAAAPAAAPAAPAPAASPQGDASAVTVISRAAERPTDTLSLSQGVDALTRARQRERAAGAGQPQQPQQSAAPAAPAPAPASAGQPPPATAGQGADPLSAFIDQFQPGPTTPTRDGGEPGADDPPRARTFDVVINGETHQFSEAQITEHFNKSRHFTQRAQQLAAQTQELADARRQINELLPTLVPQLERQISALEADVGADNIDWERLAIEDPAEYARKHARLMMAQRERVKLDQMQRAMADEANQSMRQQMQRSHDHLAQALPGWEDPGRRQQIQTRLRSWAAEQGFSARELDGVFDHRLIMTMTKASAFDHLMAQARNGTGAPVVPTVQRGLPPPQPQRSSLLHPAETAFSEAPNIKTGAALLSAQRAAKAAAAARGRR